MNFIPCPAQASFRGPFQPLVRPEFSLWEISGALDFKKISFSHESLQKKIKN
jgi:hypothetical protein